MHMESLQRLAFGASGLRSLGDLSGVALAETEAWLPILLDAAVKGVVLLVAAAAVVTAMRRKSAAARQVVWLLALTALLTLPLASAALPSWGVLPGWA